MMTVGEIRALLDGLDDSLEVRLATQPHYPFENSIAGLRAVNPRQGDIDAIHEAIASGLQVDELAEAMSELEDAQATPEIVYVLEGSQMGYASRDLWSM